MNNFIEFFNTFLSYIVVLVVMTIVIFIAVKLGILWSKKKDAKAFEIAESEKSELKK